jgi:hypothetical protein
MTTMKTKKAREVAGGVVAAAGLCIIGAVACQVDVISGDDGEGGQGGQGGQPSVTIVTSGTTAGYTVNTVGSTVAGTTGYSASTGRSTAYTTGAVGSTAGSGMCPPDPNWGGNCTAVASTAAGGTEKFCMWQQADCPQGDAIDIECDGATGLCTCTGSGESCFCNWNVPPEIGQCGAPCCGGDPNQF